MMYNKKIYFVITIITWYVMQKQKQLNTKFNTFL